MGISMDVLGAISALTVVLTLQTDHDTMTSLAQRREEAQSKIRDLETGFAGKDREDEIKALTKTITETWDLAKAPYLQRKIRGTLSNTIMKMGILCFFIALLCYCIDSQPRVVWIPTSILIVTCLVAFVVDWIRGFILGCCQ